MELLKSDFYYDLPEELIAQHPVEPRNASRMMCVDRRTGEISHDHFYNLCDHLREGDLLVMNDSRVIPARLYGEKVGNQTFIEFLLLDICRICFIHDNHCESAVDLIDALDFLIQAFVVATI